MEDGERLPPSSIFHPPSSFYCLAVGWAPMTMGSQLATISATITNTKATSAQIRNVFLIFGFIDLAG
jgi:hypothetical protein